MRKTFASRQTDHVLDVDAEWAALEVELGEEIPYRIRRAVEGYRITSHCHSLSDAYRRYTRKL